MNLHPEPHPDTRLRLQLPRRPVQPWVSVVVLYPIGIRSDAGQKGSSCRTAKTQARLDIGPSTAEDSTLDCRKSFPSSSLTNQTLHCTSSRLNQYMYPLLVHCTTCFLLISCQDQHDKACSTGTTDLSRSCGPLACIWRCASLARTRSSRHAPMHFRPDTGASHQSISFAHLRRNSIVP